MKTQLTMLDLQNYQRSYESYILSELISQCDGIYTLLTCDQSDLVMMPESISNLEDTGFSNWQAYAFVSRLRYLGELVAELSWAEGSIKDNNKDVPWQAIMGLGQKVEQLWLSEQDMWPSQNPDEATRATSEVKFYTFLQSLLRDDLPELITRLSHAKTKEHLRFYNFPHAGLTFSGTRSAALWGARTKDNGEDEPDADDSFVDTRWYEDSQLLQTLCYPNEAGKAPLVFKKEDNKAVSGLKNIRQLVEPIFDANCLDEMLIIIDDIASCDMQNKTAREAFLTASQMLGEYCHQLSDSFKTNISDVTKFPFELVYGLRNTIKVATTRMKSIDALYNALDDKDSEHTFKALQKELCSLKAIVERFKGDVSVFTGNSLPDSLQRTWIVFNATHFQNPPMDENHLDKDSQRLIAVFDDLCQDFVDSAVDDAKCVMQKVLCHEFPYIETKKERKEIVASIGNIATKACQQSYKDLNTTAERKGQMNKNRKTLTRLLNKKIVDEINIPGSYNVGVTSTHCPGIVSFCQELTAVSPDSKPSEKDYIEGQINQVISAIDRIIAIVEQLNPHSATELAQLIDDNVDVSYAVKLYATIIGQAVGALTRGDVLHSYADDNLIEELLSLRWVRNNEMHNMNQPIGESFLRWYNPRVHDGDHRLKASEISSYVHTIKSHLVDLKKRVAGNKKADLTSFVVSSLKHQLRHAVEGAAIEYIMCVPDKNWLYRDIVFMTWQFLLGTQTIQARFVVPLNIKIGAVRGEGEVDAKRLLRCYLRSAAYYLLQQGTDCSAWISFYDLDQHLENILAIANENDLEVTGVDGGPLSTGALSKFQIMVSHKKNSSVRHKQDRDLAQFRKKITGLLGDSVDVQTNPDTQPRFQLLKVVDSFRLFQLLDNGHALTEVMYHINGRDIDVNFYVRGYTCLHILTNQYHDEELGSATKMLTDGMKADTRLLNKHGNAVLHDAAQDNDPAFCEVLLECGADPNQLNRQGQLPIELAAKRNSQDVYELLLPVSKLTSQQQLMCAIHLGDSAHVSKIIDGNDLNIDQPDSFGDYPVVLAVENGDLRMLQTLNNHGANLEIMVDGNNLLHIHCASSNLNPELVSYLINEIGLDVNARNSQGDTVLHCAARCQDVAIVEVVLQASADPHVLNNSQKIPLHLLAMGRHLGDHAIAIAKKLIEAGVRLEQEDQDYGTVLHLAALENHHELAKWIIDQQPSLVGRRCNCMFYQNATPLEVAKSEKHHQLVALFSKVVNRHRLQHTLFSAMGGLLMMGAGWLYASDESPMAKRLGVGAMFGVLGFFAVKRGCSFFRPYVDHQSDDAFKLF